MDTAARPEDQESRCGVLVECADQLASGVERAAIAKEVSPLEGIGERHEGEYDRGEQEEVFRVSRGDGSGGADGATSVEGEKECGDAEDERSERQTRVDYVQVGSVNRSVERRIF